MKFVLIKINPWGIKVPEVEETLKFKFIDET